jgi:hypothetical protein
MPIMLAKSGIKMANKTKAILLKFEILDLVIKIIAINSRTTCAINKYGRKLLGNRNSIIYSD